MLIINRDNTKNRQEINLDLLLVSMSNIDTTFYEGFFEQHVIFFQRNTYIQILGLYLFPIEKHIGRNPRFDRVLPKGDFSVFFIQDETFRFSYPR